MNRSRITSAHTGRSNPEQTENIMLLCQNTKAVYHQGGRVTAMTTQLHQNQGGQAKTTIWMGILKHIMQAKQGQYIPKFPPNTLDFTKTMFRETVEHQLELGAKLTLRGYLSRKWIIALSTSTGQNLTTEQHGHKWARTAISQLWKVTALSAARTARKEELHREKHADISQSAQNERIRRIYMLEGEICTQDKHFFGTELEILLKSRMSKKAGSWKDQTS